MVESSESKKRGWYWPVLVLALLGALLLMNGVMLYVATRDPSFAVEKDYYQKALDWDQKRARDVASDALGWSIAVSLESAEGGIRVVATVADREGAPVDGANVALEAFHVARSAAERNVTLSEESPGRYEVRWPAMRPGLWELRFRVEKGEQRFTKTIRESWAP